MRASIGAVILALTLVDQTGGASQPAPAGDTFTLPTFGRVAVYSLSGPPNSVVLFVSGDGGWNLGVVPMAQRLRDLGALVVGIDIRMFVKSLEASRDCAYPAGALEELSRAIQLRYRLPTYKPPVLVGYSSGATLCMRRSWPRRQRRLPARSVWASVPCSSYTMPRVKCAA